MAAPSYTVLLRQDGGEGLSPPLKSSAPHGARGSRLKRDDTIVIVTHHMQQAARVPADRLLPLDGAGRAGRLVEMNPTRKVFSSPEHPDTEAYVAGRFG